MLMPLIFFAFNLRNSLLERGDKPEKGEGLM